jgi:hypothetical protein
MNLSHVMCNTCGYAAGEIEFIHFDGYYRCPCCQNKDLHAYTPEDYNDYIGMIEPPKDET